MECTEEKERDGQRKGSALWVAALVQPKVGGCPGSVRTKLQRMAVLQSQSFSPASLCAHWADWCHGSTPILHVLGTMVNDTARVLPHSVLPTAILPQGTAQDCFGMGSSPPVKPETHREGKKGREKQR